MILTFLALTVLAAPARSTTVELQGQVFQENGREGKWAAVWLENGEHGTPVPRFKIGQKGREFNPHISVLPIGSKIDFVNDDDIYHNVFADYDAKKFDLGFYPKGTSRAVQFDKPGLIAIYCQIHEEMSAFVVIVDSAYYTKADEHGRFKIRNVPPGQYVLRSWHENRQSIREPVTVREGMQQLDLKLKRD